MAITSWTSEGMTWPLAAGEPIYRKHIEAVRLAWLERWNASTSNTPETALTTSVIPNEPIVSGAGSLPSAIDQARELRVPNYINNEDSGGDWNGSATPPPNWSEADILTAIGGGANYIQQAIECPITVDWINEHYNILNKLLWADNTNSLTVNSNDKRTGSGGSYAAAVTSWNGAGWIASSNNPRIFSRDIGTVTVERSRRNFSLTVWNGKESTVEIYWKFKLDFLGTIYDNQDYPLANIANDWATIYKTTVEALLASYAFDFGNFPTYDGLAPPGFGDGTGWSSDADGVANSRKIVKYDGINGFDFKL